MTMPSIADVQKASTGQWIDYLAEKSKYEPLNPGDRSLLTLCQFAQSVLNAPGMTAERLGWIEKHYRDCGYYEYEELGELLAEVMRLRAGVDGGQQPERVIPPADGVDRIE